MLALSVSTSAMISPIATRSPGCLSHFRILPSSIVSESFGMVTSTGMRALGLPPPLHARRRYGCAHRLLHPEQPADGRDRARRRRQPPLLLVAPVGHGHVQAPDALGRRADLVEGVARDQRLHLGRPAAERPPLLVDA